MTAPSILEEIRRVRHAVSQRIGHDPRKIAAYSAELQQLHRDRIVNLSGDSSLGQFEAEAETDGGSIPAEASPVSR